MILGFLTLTLAEAPFDLLQEVLNSEDREQLWNYVKLLDDDGTGVNRVRSIQLFIKANGVEETNAWKKLVANEAPLGMAGSKFCSRFCHGNINISWRKATLKEAYNHLCAMIALPIDSFLPRHHQEEYQAEKHTHSSAFPFDIVSSLDESSDDDRTQKSAKKAKKMADDMDDMEMENLEALQQVLHAKILKRKSMEPTSMEAASMEAKPKP